ncbi:MAG: DUF4157 domain-containing protein [Flavobacteriales bacterium]|nr:DUF4157 domain-containing protein [Flavobacteriales bacterium]
MFSRKKIKKNEESQPHSGSFIKPTVQQKLKIGESNDKYEQEADRVADKVVNQSKGDAVQTKEGEEEVQKKPIASEVTPLVQKKGTGEEEPVQKMTDEEPVQKQEEEEAVQSKEEEESVQMQEEEETVQSKEEEESVQMQEEEEVAQTKEEEESIQTKAQARPNSATPSLESRLNNSSGRGKKLTGKTKNEMESGFGNDFSNVNIHTDQNAAQMSQELGAKAFAHGNDIYFNKGQYNPESSEGKHLLAHELTHTIQQKGMVQKKVQRDLAVEPPNPKAVAKTLTDSEVESAIKYNKKRFKRESELKTLRDVLGLLHDVATIDKEFVQTVAQWQAENNLKVDGKIGPRTAAVIGYEMLQESKIDASLKPEAIRMLERGIVLSLSNDTYNDSATESRKKITFKVTVPKGLKREDYALVNWNKGFYKKGDGTYYKAQDYGTSREVNFATWQVDSLDKDPVYWSTAGSRWNYTKSGKRSFTATDDPGQAKSTQKGSHFKLDFKLQVYRLSDIPKTTTGTLGGAESKAIATVFWKYHVKVSATGTFSH